MLLYNVYITLTEGLLRPDLSIERVAALAQDNALPIPDLDLSSVAASTSAFTYPSSSPAPIRAPVPTRSYTTEDPWNISKFANTPAGISGSGSITNGVTSSISGTGLPKDWWKRQEAVNVNILGQQGFILNRYLVYEVSTDVWLLHSQMETVTEFDFQRGAPVPRRYSEFVFLWEVLVKRYPFRLLPSLPPKRIGRKLGLIDVSVCFQLTFSS